MHFVTKFVVAVAALTAGVTAQLTVASPPALIQCQPVSLSWSGSTAGGPYFVALIPGGQASAAPLKDLGEIANSPYSWTVDIAAGTSVTIRVTDQSGTPQYSDPITIQSSQSSSCLTGGSSASGSASASGASGASESAASATGSMSGSGSSSGSASPTGSGAAATSSPNAGSSVVVGSLTGLAGLVIAALGVVA